MGLTHPAAVRLCNPLKSSYDWGLSTILEWGKAFWRLSSIYSWIQPMKVLWKIRNGDSACCIYALQVKLFCFFKTNRLKMPCKVNYYKSNLGRPLYSWTFIHIYHYLSSKSQVTAWPGEKEKWMLWSYFSASCNIWTLVRLDKERWIELE